MDASQTRIRASWPAVPLGPARGANRAARPARHSGRRAALIGRPVPPAPLDGVTVQQALDNVMATSQLSYRVLGERSIFVMSDPKNVKHEVRTDTAGYFQLVGLMTGAADSWDAVLISGKW